MSSYPHDAGVGRASAPGPIDDPIDELLRLRARNERPVVTHKHEFPKRSAALYVLEGHAGQATSSHLGQTSGLLGRRTVLFAGIYQVRLNGTWRNLRVLPGRSTAAKAGAIMVRSRRPGVFSIAHLRSSRIIARGIANRRPIAVFGGSYRVSLRGERRIAQVLPGRITRLLFVGRRPAPIRWAISSLICRAAIAITTPRRWW